MPQDKQLTGWVHKPHPLGDRLPKDFLSSQPPLDMPLDTALPTRGPGPMSTHQWAGIFPALQESHSSLWTSLTYQKADTRCKKTTISQPVDPAYTQRARHCPGISWAMVLPTSRPTQSLGGPETPYLIVSGTGPTHQRSDTCSGIPEPWSQTLE